jgi:hypothetical protein
MTFGPIPGFRDDDDEAPPPRPGAFPGINGTAYAGRTAGPAAGSATEPWPVPLDLFAEHLAAGAAVDETCLPATILCFARAEAARLGVDPVGIAGLCVAVCSGAISDDWSVRLKRHDHWSQQPRLWVGLVDRPGSKKTEQIRAAKRPLDRMEAEARREFQLAAAAHKIAHEAWAKLPKKERDAQPEPEKPAEKRLTTQDSTIEAFSELLKSMPKIVALLDELAGFLASFDRYSSGGGKGSPGRSHAIELYEGGPRRIDRVMRGSVYVENWSAVVLGAIQPEKLRPMVADLSTDGLLQRFMFVMPSAVSAADPDDDDRPADKAALDAYEALVRRLAALRPPERDGGGFLQAWAEEAVRPHRRALFRLVERVEADPTLPAALRETVAKWRGLLARLALVFHCVGLAEGRGTDDPATLRAATVSMAADFIRRVVAPSTFRFYRDLGLDGDPHARWVAGHILAHRLERISARDIGRAYRELRGDLPGIIRAMELLEHAGWVRGDHHPKAPKWEVNPAVQRAFAERAAAERAHRERTQELIRTSISELCG